MWLYVVGFFFKLYIWVFFLLMKVCDEVIFLLIQWVTGFFKLNYFNLFLIENLRGGFFLIICILNKCMRLVFFKLSYLGFLLLMKIWDEVFLSCYIEHLACFSGGYFYGYYVLAYLCILYSLYFYFNGISCYHIQYSIPFLFSCSIR